MELKKPVDHVLIIAPPGTGATMWARRQNRWLNPVMKLEAERIYHHAGLGDVFRPDPHNRDDRTLSIDRAPVRAPHHTISLAGMCGRVHNGWAPQPGELSLSHGGVLFLDELPEFSELVIDAVLHALAHGYTEISTPHAGVFRVPAQFRLIAAATPCPCGWFGSSRRVCSCPRGAVGKWRAKLARVESRMRVMREAELTAEVAKIRD